MRWSNGVPALIRQGKVFWTFFFSIFPSFPSTSTSIIRRIVISLVLVIFEIYLVEIDIAVFFVFSDSILIFASDFIIPFYKLKPTFSTKEFFSIVLGNSNRHATDKNKVSHTAICFIRIVQNSCRWNGYCLKFNPFCTLGKSGERD